MIAAPALAAYNASKAAVWMLTKSVALQCAKKGWDIRCNSVHPTFIDTDLLDNFSLDESVPHTATVDKLAAQVPLGRVGEPEDVAFGVLYLASDESRYMTGSELKLDGGISAG
jgi:NAD(P)-dependent dehydrogenase (short-subunit alcohol dehydrogenase family)